MERDIMTPPLPDSERSRRIYPLLQNQDLENVSQATLKSVGDPISIENLNEDELRKLVLVNLARLSVKGEWNGLLNAASGGGGAEMPAGAAPSPGGNGYLVQYPMFYPNSDAETSSNGVIDFDKTKMTLFPFWVYADGTMESITCRLAVTNPDNIMIALYSSGDDHCPKTRIGTAVEWDMSTSGVITLDLGGVGDWSVSGNTQYWLGIMLKTDNTNRPNWYVMNAADASFTIPTTSTDTENYRLENQSMYVTGLTAGTPPSSIPPTSTGIFSKSSFTPWMTHTLA